ncbi:ferritin-like domain-containing protein [Gemmata sp.]|uniref:ferritin-like domain-containing protein n=1 Tax=Gemmata sp. TaxID=1914242 RepID=UPI003F7280FD
MNGHEPDPAGRPEVRSSREWVAYFEANARRLLPVPWGAGAGVTDAERDAVAGSLAAWQLGETSDGRHLLAAAAGYAERVGDPDFPAAVRLFIAEEQRHGRDLGRFLELAGVPVKTWDWGDALFRAFRYALPRMEVWAAVVVVVEAHAMLYYAAVRRATRSPVLRTVCRQILADEVPHIRFQCERLAVLRRGRARPLRWATAAADRVLFTGVTLAVWLGHRRALRAGGYDLLRFWRAALARMRAAWRAADPNAYAWPAVTSSSGGRLPGSRTRPPTGRCRGAAAPSRP